MKTIMLEVQKRAGSDPVAQMLDKKVRQWHDLAYGSDPVGFDAIGRMIEPTRQRAMGGSGPVHVDACSQSRDCKAVSVSSHTRSRPS